MLGASWDWKNDANGRKIIIQLTSKPNHPWYIECPGTARYSAKFRGWREQTNQKNGWQFYFLKSLPLVPGMSLNVKKTGKGSNKRNNQNLPYAKHWPSCVYLWMFRYSVKQKGWERNDRARKNLHFKDMHVWVLIRPPPPNNNFDSLRDYVSENNLRRLF